MKKILILLLLIIFVNGGNYSYANETAQDVQEETPVLEASIQYDWLNIEQAQRDAKILYFHERLFGDGKAVNMKRKEFRKTYKNFLKDEKYKTHYRLIVNGVQETKDFNLSGFFKNYKSNVILYSYAMQPKNDLKHIYYYTAFGSLAYMDILEGDYPNFPYISRQYRANGQLAGVIYFENHDLQYVYKPNGEFKGLWFKDKMYDRKAKEILSRSNW
ncbi:hypothetical protein IKP85_02745 [bacterium]|nr:hypothetical protein [bacterium]